MIHQVFLLFLAFVQHQIVNCQNFALPCYIGTDIDTFPLEIYRSFKTVLRAIFKVLTCVRFLFHLKRIGIKPLYCITFLIVCIAWLRVYISQVIEQLRVLIEIIHAVR